jgi:hypothetical protein
MTASELLILLNNSLTALQTERATAFSGGLVERVLEIDVKIIEIQITIDQIKGI